MIPLIATDAKTMQTFSVADGDLAVAEGDFDFADLIATLADADKAVTDDVAVSSDDRAIDAETPRDMPEDDISLLRAIGEEVDVEQTEVLIAPISDAKKVVDRQLPQSAEVRLALPKMPRPTADSDAEEVLDKAASGLDAKAPVADKKTIALPTAAQSVVEGQFPREAPRDAVMDRKARTKSDAERSTQWPAPNRAKVAATAKNVAPAAPETVALHTPPTKRQIAPTDLETAAPAARDGWSMTPTKTTHGATVPQAVVTIADPLVQLQVMQPENGKPVVGLDIAAEMLLPSAAGDRAATTVPSTLAPSVAASPDMARHVAGQLAAAVTAQPGRATEITLSPKELGKVRLSMTSIDTAITLTVIADRPETTDLLRRHIDVLAQEFKALGFEDIAFSFGERGQADREGDANDGNDPLMESQIDVTETPMQIRATGTESGLDLRL